MTSSPRPASRLTWLIIAAAVSICASIFLGAWAQRGSDHDRLITYTTKYDTHTKDADDRYEMLSQHLAAIDTAVDALHQRLDTDHALLQSNNALIKENHDLLKKLRKDLP